MLAIFTTIFGFLGPFLPEALKLFREAADRKHELAMIELRMKGAAQERLWRMEEVAAQADIAEAKTLRQPEQSFGVQLLDAAHAKALRPAVLAFGFVLFAILDWLTAMVRPAVTYAFVGLYLAVKWAQYEMFFLLSTDMTVAKALVYIWREEDLAVLTLVLSFWFGQRTAKWAFGSGLPK